MSAYCEIPPPARLAEVVECCWISTPSAATHRVLPDGCADIVFRFQSNRPQLLAVGAMTRYQDLPDSAESATVGIRFRPGMWARMLGISAHRLTDCIIPLEELWGASAQELRERLANAPSVHTRAAMITNAIHANENRTPVQRAIGFLEQQRGSVSLDYLANESNLSTRQFRRICIQETGLTPNLLARIFRFRHAASRATAEKGRHAALALDCGFVDQAHMIAEFQKFAGRTPAR